ncbi:hypothetical protein [Ramlibacter sp.]|uniref:hypothetical protein n=1 Tax=Ramlibacter sp. TaxID=1917967 RepID=UPI002C35DE2D|nr:hypothetical protein [Ramlibacter sp.]HWI82468.1 hypothetical protein [Ramlibacter sp.]
MLKHSILALTLGLAFAAHAQAPAPSSPAKKDLVARILKQQQPGIESIARSLVEQPALDVLGGAGNVLQARVPKEKQEGLAKEIQADVQKYLESTVPPVQQRAVAIAPASIGAMLEEKFSEDELKQLASIVESPIYRRFQAMGDDMHKVLADKLVADTRSTVEPKVRALEETVAKRLGVTPSTAKPPAASGAAKPAKPASK